MALPDLKDWLERKKAPRAKMKRIRPVSKRREKELREYLKLRDRFLLENPVCAIWRHFNVEASLGRETPAGWTKKVLLSEECHHRAGRTGKRLNDTKYWLAVSRWGHEYVHQNPKWAYENGFLLPR